MTSGATLRARPSLLLACGASAWLFAWAAWVLPSERGTLLGLLAALLAAAHAVTLGVALLQPARLLLAWRALSWLSLAAGALFVGAIGWSAWVLATRFGNVGGGVAALLGAIAVLVTLATLPFAVWGLRATRKAPDGV
jgi:hypothetical protein